MNLALAILKLLDMPNPLKNLDLFEFNDLFLQVAKNSLSSNWDIYSRTLEFNLIPNTEGPKGIQQVACALQATSRYETGIIFKYQF